MGVEMISKEAHILFVCQLGEERSKFMAAICNEIAKEYGLNRIAFRHSPYYKVKRFLKKGSYDLIMATDDIADKVQEILKDMAVNVMAGMPNNCYKYKNLKDNSPLCANCPFFAKCARMTKQDKEMVWLTKKVTGYAKVSEKTFQELVQAIFTVLSQYRSVQIYKS